MCYQRPQSRSDQILATQPVRLDLDIGDGNDADVADDIDYLLETSRRKRGLASRPWLRCLTHRRFATSTRSASREAGGVGRSVPEAARRQTSVQIGSFNGQLCADADHDVADLLAGVDITVGVDDLVQRVDAVDDRRELTGLDELSEMAHLVLAVGLDGDDDPLAR
jgi:hypothetical protein